MERSERIECVKISNLRKLGYSSFKEWYSIDGNVYIGKGGSQQGFKYRSSKFLNPHTSFQPEKYRSHILLSIKKGKIGLNDVLLIHDSKQLGCFCEGEECIAPTLLEIVTNIVECRKKLDV